MKAGVVYISLIIVIATAFSSCKKNNINNTGTKHGVKRIEDILGGDNQNLISLLNKVRGSVGTRGPASKTIWSRKNDYGLGLYISANHVYNINGWSSRKAQYFDLCREDLGIFETSQIPSRNGATALGDTLIADFPLMHFDISPDATNTTLLPAEDFYLGIVDNQRHKQTLLAVRPELIDTTKPLDIFDLHNRSKERETWAMAVIGQEAIAVGYPQDKESYPNGAVATGKIMSDAEANDAISKMKAAGDPEGGIAYNPEAEFFLEAEGIAGMSGGGVFNAEGQLLGIIVRASDAADAPKIIRVVRVSFIRTKILEFYNRLPQADKNKIRPYISGEF